MFIEFIGKTTKAPEERHRRWLPGTCRSSGACALFPGRIYKHVAPTVRKRFCNRLLSRGHEAGWDFRLGDSRDGSERW